MQKRINSWLTSKEFFSESDKPYISRLPGHGSEGEDCKQIISEFSTY